MKRKHLFAVQFAVIAVLLLSFQTAFAQQKSYFVDARDGDLTILNNGDVKFLETWRFQFTGGPFQHVFRKIPKSRLTGLKDLTVGEGNILYRQSTAKTPGTFSVVESSEGWQIDWYFSPASNQAKEFTFGYTTQGSLRIADAGDQFWWKFIEADRDYTIRNSRVRLHLPDSFGADKLKATSYLNTKEAGGVQIIDPSTIEFIGNNFAPQTFWEIRAQFPHGSVNATAPAWQKIEDQQPIWNLLSFASSIIITIAGGLGLFLLWFTKGREHPTGIVAEYYPQPPDDLTPAEAGALVRGSPDLKGIVATMVDLANRRYLTFKERRDGGQRGFTDSSFSFERTEKSVGDLRPFERSLVDGLFNSGDKRDLEDLKNQFYTHLPTIKAEVDQSLKKRGYEPAAGGAQRWAFAAVGVLGTLAVFCAGTTIFAALGDIAPASFFVVLALGFVTVGLVVVSPFLSRMTREGATAKARWKAFKRYLQHIDRYTKVEEARDQFQKYLPYAVAFGLERSWVDRFAQTDTPAPFWYYPYGYNDYGYAGSHYPAGYSQTAGRGSSESSSSEGGRPPTLDQAASGAFGGLSSMSSGFFSMLDSAGSVFSTSPAPTSSGSSDGGGWSGGDSGGWSGGGDSGGGGGGGGSSGAD